MASEMRVRDSDRCRGCGSFVSASYRRVFGRDGVVWACADCESMAAIRNGAAADPEVYVPDGSTAAAEFREVPTLE